MNNSASFTYKGNDVFLLCLYGSIDMFETFYVKQSYLLMVYHYHAIFLFIEYGIGHFGIAEVIED